jgi:transporter family protein
MLGIIYALVAAMGQGVGYTILKKSSNEFPSSIAFLFDALLGVLIWIPFSLLRGIQIDGIGQVFLYTFISAILAEAFIFYILSKGELSITGTIFATYPVFTIIISRLINNEVLSPKQSISVFITILGILVLSLPQKLKLKEISNRAYVIYPILGASAVGISDSLSKRALADTNQATFLFCLAISQIPVALAYLRIEGQKLDLLKDIILSPKKYRFSFLGSLSIVFSLIFFWLAFENTYASIASPITASYTVFLLIFARIFLKEKIMIKDAVGIVITICGIFGTAILL